MDVRLGNNFDGEIMTCSDEFVEIPKEFDDLIEDNNLTAHKPVSNECEKVSDMFTSRELCEGMVFDDLEDAYSCYNAYALQKGFSIRKNHTRLSRKDKSLIGVEYVCSREGFSRDFSKGKNEVGIKHAITRIGCKAIMSLRLEDEKWIVSKFDDKHNHEFCTPKSTRLLRGNRKFTPAQKSLINTLNEAGVPTRKIMAVLGQQSGGENNIGCTSSNIQDYLGSKRKQMLKDGDAERMYRYFQECQSKNPGFFYAIQVGNDNRMQNCFWADTRSRLAYQYFGDAVTFDATYLTNCYSMPFVPFTGVNHHFQSVMFGCALLINETIDSYVWLLTTWLTAMGGSCPKTIITDDDKSMAQAIAHVLPETTHHLCMWHLLQKFPEHLAHIYNKNPSFKSELHHCIHGTSLVEEFELEWHELLRKYELEDNCWLKNLFSRREKWVPAYVRRTFCAGMSTTQRSESMNKFFKDFVRSSTLVSDFIFQYEKALSSRCLKEKEKDVKTRNSLPILKTCYQIEKEAAKIYTRKIFLKFQEELFTSQKFKATKVLEEGGKKMYKVVPTEKEKPTFSVALYVSEGKSTCSCHLFEFCGILCRHILTVLVKKSLTSCFPQQYILNRWTMKAKLSGSENTSSYGVDVVEAPLTVLRHNIIMEFLEVVELGNSKEKFSILRGAVQKIREDFRAMDDAEMQSEATMNAEEKSGMVSRILPWSDDHVASQSSFNLEDPINVISRGRPKSLRQKNPKENQPVKKRKCGFCQQIGHNRTSCTSSKQKRDEAREQESNGRAFDQTGPN